MVHPVSIHPLTAFLRDHEAYLERLRHTGQPEVFTVDGEARVVIQDAEAYRKLLDLLDTIDAERIIRHRLASLDSGEAGVPDHEALAAVRERLGIDKR